MVEALETTQERICYVCGFDELNLKVLTSLNHHAVIDVLEMTYLKAT